MGKRRTSIAEECLESVLADLRREARKRFIHDEVGVVQNEELELWDKMNEKLPELVRLARIQPKAYKGFCIAVLEPLEVEKRLRSAQEAILALSEWQQSVVESRLQPVIVDCFDHPMMTGPTGYRRF